MTFAANGPSPIIEESPLRIIWFGQSVISDWNNPIATTVRATMRALQAAGHQVTFLEPRSSPPFVAALAARGWAPYRDFQTHYSDLHYRTYEMPRRAERDVWLSREAALVDAVIVQSDAPVEIFQWLERVPDSSMVRVFLSLDREKHVPDTFDLVLAPTPESIDHRFESAVLPVNKDESAQPGGTLVAVYADADLAVVRSKWPGDDIEAISVGAGAPQEMPYISEVAIVGRYSRAKRVVIVDSDPSPFAAARAMLARATGSETWRLVGSGSLEPIERFVNAYGQAARLVRMIESKRAPARHRRPAIEPHDS